MTTDLYIVVICGYVGISEMFGPFDHSKAEKLALKLIAQAPESLIKDRHSEKQYSAARRRAKRLGTNLFKPEEVCIMAPKGKDHRLECTCKAFPVPPSQHTFLH